MPTDTPDQQITMPVDADAADNPLAFSQAVGDIEPRLVREYTTEADRTARMLSLSVNDISSLSAPTSGLARLDSYSGTAHQSLYVRGFHSFVRKASNQTINNSTTLTNDTALLASLPSTGTHMFEMDIIYSSTTVADIKFAMTIPAGAFLTLLGVGLATTATTSVGDMNNFATATAGTAGAFGGIGAGSFLPLRLWGEVATGGTAGNMTLQWAQNTLEATNTVVHNGSRMFVWKTS